MSNFAYSSIPLNQPESQGKKEQSTSPGESEGIRWEIVARTSGLTPATILAGRLQAEGITARAWQEGAGRALGLTVGILGTGYVSVPEEQVDEALDILENEEEVVNDSDDVDNIIGTDEEV